MYAIFFLIVTVSGITAFIPLAVQPWRLDSPFSISKPKVLPTSSLRMFRPVATVTTAAVVSTLLFVPPSYADDVQVDAAESSELALVTADAVGAELSETAPFIEVSEGVLLAESRVAVEGSEVLLGEAYPNISLPSGAAEGLVSDDGTAVFADAAPGLDVIVEAGDEGLARILTVADEESSDTSEHRYSYEIDLPDGAVLEQSDQGTVFVLAPAPTAVENEPVDLSDVLPADNEDAEGTDWVDGEDVATEEELAGDFEVAEGWEVVGAYQTAWSVDADGTRLPTHYEIENNTITQVVDTTGAQFPVVSDPIPLVAVGLLAVARALLPIALRSGAKALATQTIRAGVRATTKGRYRTFSAFKKDIAGSTPKNNQWHHIVEQSNITKRKWDPRWVHNRNNLVSIPKQVHQKCVNSWMAKKNVKKFGISSGSKTMRQTDHTLSFSRQHQIGIALLKHCGVKF